MHSINEDSLNDWEEILNDFRFLFRYEDQLINENWMTASEFLEEFYDTVERAARLLRKSAPEK